MKFVFSKVTNLLILANLTDTCKFNIIFDASSVLPGLYDNLMMTASVSFSRELWYHGKGYNKCFVLGFTLKAPL